MSAPDKLPPEDRFAELHALAEASLRGEISDEQIARLEQLVGESSELRERYVRYMFVSWNLKTWAKFPLPGEPSADDAEVSDGDDAHIVPLIKVAPAERTSRTTFRSLFSQALFPYTVSALILCVAIFGAWLYRVGHDRQTVENGRPPAPIEQPDVELKYAGVVTNVRDCVWADPGTAAVVGASIPMGRKYDLASGLLELTYESGTKVIVEGPSEFLVDSSAGGYLKRGKLVARVEKKVASGQWPVARKEEAVESGEWRVEGKKSSNRIAAEAASKKLLATSHQPLTTNPQSPAPSLSTLHSPLFTITTPTAIVTDLGTEFGVEVDRSGNCTAHVFEGKICVKSSGENSGGKPTELNAGESARVERGSNEVKVNRSAAGTTRHFVRGITHRGPIHVFDTGYRVHCGNPDPRWRIIRGKNDPNFRPGQAVTTAVTPKAYRKNIAGELLWISTDRDLPVLPEETVYTFQTSFHLNGDPPDGLELHVAFAVDNHVDAIRINGKPVDVPEHGYLLPFFDMHELVIADGFVSGANTLEFDVSNGAPTVPKRLSPMALIVDMETVVKQGGDRKADPEGQKRPENGGKEAN